jgi:hypothetical protein
MPAYSFRLATKQRGRRYSLTAIGCLTAITICCTAALTSQAHAEPECMGAQVATCVGDEFMFEEVTITDNSTGVVRLPPVIVKGQRPLPEVSPAQLEAMAEATRLEMQKEQFKAAKETCLATAAGKFGACTANVNTACSTAGGATGAAASTLCKYVPPRAKFLCTVLAGGAGGGGGGECIRQAGQLCEAQLKKDVVACDAPPAAPQPRSPVVKQVPR